MFCPPQQPHEKQKKKRQILSQRISEQREYREFEN